MDRGEMLKRLGMGEDPLEVAIQKWKDIRAGKGYCSHSSNCALCEIHWMDECINNKGEECPVREAGYHACLGSPYTEWNDHHMRCHNGLRQRVRCTTCREIADREVSLLESLRISEEVKEKDL